MLKARHNSNMVTQLVLFDNLGKIKHSRCHYKIPTYYKVYSVIRYDDKKFRQYLNYKLNGYKCVRYLRQIDILKLCYLRDQFGVIHDCDEKHIYRIKNLCDIHKKLFDKVNPETMWNSKGSVERDGLVSHLDTREAEIKGTWQLPIKKRLKLHIRLLWLLKDYSVTESMDWINEVDIKKL